MTRDNVMDYGPGAYTTYTYDQRERIQHVLKHGLWVSNLPKSTK